MSVFCFLEAKLAHSSVSNGDIQAEKRERERERLMNAYNNEHKGEGEGERERERVGNSKNATG